MNPIEKLILLSGCTQREFANKVGETEPALSAYKKGRRQISLSKFLGWCKILGFKDWDAIFN